MGGEEVGSHGRGAPAGPRRVGDNGFTVLAYTADVTGVDWAHTLGLHARSEHPELVLVGLPAPFAAALLESLGERVLRGDRLPPGAVVRVGPVLLRFEVVSDLFRHQGDWFRLGRELLEKAGGRWPRSLQVLWADEDGFPEGPEDQRWLGRQPLLFEPAPSILGSSRAS